MKLTIVLFGFAALLSAQDQAANPLMSGSKTVFGISKRNILGSVETIPENLWSFQPTDKVRTIAQLFAHIADGQYEFCGAAMTGQPVDKGIEKTAKTKAEIVSALNKAFAYCDEAYSSLNDAKASEQVKFFGMNLTRVAILDFNTAHNMEHYGNLVTYMRLKKHRAAVQRAPTAGEKIGHKIEGMLRGIVGLFACAALALAQPNLGLPPCADGPLFTVIPMALDDFLAFRPLGFISIPSNAFPVKHSSFSIALPGTETPERRVLFPGDLWVTEIWSYRSANFGGYQLYFQPCAQVRNYFFHLKDISSRLKDAFQAVQPECQDFPDPSGVIVKCRANVLVQVSAREQAGISGDGAGVDFGMADFRIQPSGLVKLEHFPFDYPYYVSPVDYYPADLKEQFSTKLASWDGTVARTAEPRSGVYRPDIPGTAQGLWFRPGLDMRTNPADMTPNLALVSDYVDAEQPAIMLGSSVKDATLGLYSFTPTDSGYINRRFRDITADGSVYCFDSFLTGRSHGLMPLSRFDGILLMTMPDDTSLRVERSSAPSCEAARPWELSDAATVYGR